MQGGLCKECGVRVGLCKEDCVRRIVQGGLSKEDCARRIV